MEQRALKRQLYHEHYHTELDAQVERPVARALDRHRQHKEAIAWSRKLSTQFKRRDRQTIEWIKDRQRAEGLRQLHERNAADPLHEVLLKEHKTCSDCLYCEGGNCLWHERKIDEQVKLCGGSYWQAKAAPVEKAYAAEWLTHINQAKAAYPQYFEGIDIGFLEDMAREEEKRGPPDESGLSEFTTARLGRAITKGN